MVGYSSVAAPALDAIYKAAREDADLLRWFLEGTAVAATFARPHLMAEEQKADRGPTRQPFYVNYWCGHRVDGKETCLCSVAGSNAKETDMVLWIGNGGSARLALHLEMKSPTDRLKPGQAESYAGRAGCWSRGEKRGHYLPDHAHWATLLVCDKGAADEAACLFDRALSHGEMARRIVDYPDWSRA